MMANSRIMNRTVKFMNNPWPKKNRTEMIIERSICTTNKCFKCGALVYDLEKKKTANHIYHNRCFCCRICKRSLNASSLNEEGDDIYCGNCYRKKQRGDCNGSDFQQAAAERGKTVYNNRDSDRPSPKSTGRPVVTPNILSQNPSWTLRKLELEFLSRLKSKTSTPEIRKPEKLSKSRSLSQPFILKTTYASPISLKKFPQHSSIKNNERSPTRVRFLSTPNTYSKSNTTLKPLNETKITNQQTNSESNVFENLKSRLQQTNLELSNDLPTVNQQKNSIASDVKENKDISSPGRSRWHNINLNPQFRRNRSANYVISQWKRK
ncbi:hypothetical protein I4U23_018133 [Adineta vaga]|nr:hypothetical protein I4U23_018133 [Adineta vaga]